MKKLFSFLLVLALALAIAAPALASGWDSIPADPKTLKDITIEITALETAPNTSKLGSLYEQLSVMYPVVKGTVVHFLVEITIPAEANLSAANKALLANKGLKYLLTTENLTLTKYQYYLNGTKNGAELTVGIPKTRLFDLTNAGNVFGMEYWATADSGKAATATATIGFYNEWEPTGQGTSFFYWDTDADGIDDYDVFHVFADGVFYVGELDSTGLIPSGSGLSFPVTTGDKIDTSREMVMTYGGAFHYITRAVNGDITFRNGTTGVVVTPADTVNYPILKAVFDSFFAVLGFGYADAKYMSEDHFTKYFGTIAETSVSITYPSGTVVVTEPSVQPPQTGDAFSAIGFAMIALALFAAGYLVVRKIRA